jgi:uncharacterized protein (DUF2062 family)
MSGTNLHILWRRNVLEPLLGLTGQGLPVEAIALCVVLGLVLGVCPVFGCPTVLCSLAAILLRVNLPAIQFINYLASPLQLTLLVPFIRLGGWLFRGDQGSAAIHSGNAWQAVYAVITGGLHAIVAWFFVCAPAGLLLYLFLVCVLRRYRNWEETKRLCPTLP